MGDRLVQARGPFVAMTGNGPWAVHPGELYAADDPVVLAHPGSFDDPLVQDSRGLRRQPRGWGAGAAAPGRIVGVEAATAEPGAVRAPTRPAVSASHHADVAAPSGAPPVKARPKAAATARPDGEV